MTCDACEKVSDISGLFNFNCPVCRTRYIQREPCKYFRKVLVDFFAPRYGEFEGWKDGASCGCAKVCERKKRIRQETGDEQQVNGPRTKASSRR